MEEIQNVISEIQAKIVKMQSALRTVKSENDELTNEVQLLKTKLSQREQEFADLNDKYDELKHQNEASELLNTQHKKDNGIQIDALVREIDDCIGRLKA